MRLDEVSKLGQSIWIDALRRRMLTTGELDRLVEEVGIRGVTSNPTIFQQAIAGSDDYDTDIEEGVRGRGLSAMELYDEIVTRDTRAAADVLRPVYEVSARRDGYVSLEVSPSLAHDKARTIAEARQLWERVGRENLMIKVPGTSDGIAAMQELTTQGINVNVTLLFSREAYLRVADAYLSGLEEREERGAPIGHAASVASVFVSRVDALVDKRLAALAAKADGPTREKIASLTGRAGIANAKLIYQAYKTIASGPRVTELSARDARMQRVLWASTGTKDPRLRDTTYVEELIGPDTVSTLPPATLQAFVDHGRVRPSLEEDVDDARRVLDTLAEVGVSLDAIAEDLLTDGIAKFAASADELMRLLDQRRAAILRAA
jgi:transaldolase/glucose-6-phosphate isomerase